MYFIGYDMCRAVNLWFDAPAIKDDQQALTVAEKLPENFLYVGKQVGETKLWLSMIAGRWAWSEVEGPAIGHVPPKEG